MDSNLNKILLSSVTLIQLESLWLLGLIWVEDLPDVALELMSQGWESESLLELAACSNNEYDDIRRLFKLTLLELGGGNITVVTALKNYAIQISNSIITAEISPKKGANLIWQSIRNARSIHNFDEFEEFYDLDGFIYAADEMDDRPEDKDFFEKAIIVEAKCWIEKTLNAPRKGE